MIKCLANDPRSLSDHQTGRAAQFESNYALTPGASYLVVGMMMYETVLMFLVEDDLGSPRFAPAGMFELWDGELPEGWKFSLAAGIRATGRELWANPVVAIWGYPELIDDPGHLDGLALLDSAVLATFHSYARSHGQELGGKS
jgi:hypothetical protein